MLEIHINEHLILTQNEGLYKEQVISHKINIYGKPVGNNPLIDTYVYQVCFDDGNVQEYITNKTLDKIYSKVGIEGREHLHISDIVNHCSDVMVVRGYDLFIYKDGYTRQRSNTTKSCDLLVR